VTDYLRIAKGLMQDLSLLHRPVAVCFTDAVPDGVPQYPERVPAGCSFWQEGATASFATSAVDHALCAIGTYTHNLQAGPAQQQELMAALQLFRELDYVREEDVAALPVLQKSPRYVLYAPLDETRVRPDVVLLFVNASQALVLSEAVQQVEQDHAPAMGRPACAVVPQVANTGRAAVSMGCCGARAYLDVLREDTMLFALPGATLEAYAQRVEVLAAANRTLSRFHQIRQRELAAGRQPSIEELVVQVQTL
jgi:uncharacterized protein (DUF169 family)